MLGSIAPESLDAVEEPSLPILVDGDWRESEAEETLPVYNPAHGTVLTRVPLCPPGEVDRAVRSAASAFPAWREVPVAERVQVLFSFRQALEEHQDDLARMVATEGGALLADARDEVRRCIEVVEFACGMPALLAGETAAGTARGLEGRSARVPLGVVAAICPFGFPALVPLWTVPVAVGAGNAVVLKPSERTPMTAVRLAELLVEAGLPAGVLALVHGGRPTAEALLDHPEVRAVSFAGSEPAARQAYARAAASGKRVQAFAGVRSHLVVMPDADLDLAARAIAESAFGAAGQRCLAGSVLIPVGEAAGPILERLGREAAAVKVGDPLDEASGMGPVIRPESRERLLALIERALAEGARLVADGRAGVPARGFFLGPTILDGVRPEAALVREEVLGPVLATVRAGTLEQALALLARSGPGGAASIFTRSGRDAWLFRSRAEAAAVGVNVGVAAPMAFFPFAGWRPSFLGDLHAAGKDAVRFVTESRVVIERW
jgi:malonate-semialdehyde dehydrogenase (acetylating)/methylmalonate-semialdehyde dehydrogenase